MKKIVINVPSEWDESEISEYVEYVAGMVADGFRSGYVDSATNWESEK